MCHEICAAAKTNVNDVREQCESIGSARKADGSSDRLFVSRRVSLGRCAYAVKGERLAGNYRVCALVERVVVVLMCMGCISFNAAHAEGEVLNNGKIGAADEGGRDATVPPNSPIADTADEIRREATLPANSPIGRPLPLTGHWNTGILPNGFSPDYQMELIDEGHYILPWFQMPEPGQEKGEAYYKTAILKAAKLRLPVSFVGTQWEKVLTTENVFFGLPADVNPNVVDSFGGIRKMVSPFGPGKWWHQAGTLWTSGDLMGKLQRWYPDPPMVLFVSNNEHDKLRWTEVELDRRYVQQYGIGRDDNFKRKIVGNGWIPRYRELLQGMRHALSPAWARAAKFIGYGAFEPWVFGLYRGWEIYSLHTEDRMSPWPYVWDGASVPYYLTDYNKAQTDYTVYSPQVHAMNWNVMLEEAQRASPEFWFEISTWDGHGERPNSDKRKELAVTGKGYGTERYEGYVQFGAWLTRPRIVREFRYWKETRASEEPYFAAVMAVVDRVHKDPTLRKFWRNGEIVANPGREHPFQTDIPARFAQTKRWFLLDTDLDPVDPWKLSTELPVFALALVIGEKPNREWLVYAYSPLGERGKIMATVPDFRAAGIRASPKGVFSLVREANGDITEIENHP